MADIQKLAEQMFQSTFFAEEAKPSTVCKVCIWTSAITHLYTWVAQEHNTMFPARVQTWIVKSGVKRTSHDASTPPKPSTIEEEYNNLW